MLVAIGLCAGLLSGVLGVGGGVIMVPLMLFLLGFNQYEAQGTSLAVLVPQLHLWLLIVILRKAMLTGNMP